MRTARRLGGNVRMRRMTDAYNLAQPDAGIAGLNPRQNSLLGNGT
jgi:hypothetical protein